MLLSSGQYEWGDKSAEMYEMCFAISLTVLQKDAIKRKPRPIGSGASPMRKLGNCVLIQVSTAAMSEVMVKVINLVHGGKGANDIIPMFFQLMTELDDDDTSNKGPFGVVSTDGRNAFGAMKRTEVQHGLDQFLPEELFWMKKMFWRFHLGSTTVFYKQLDGEMIILKVTTGFIQGEHFSGFWYAIGQGPSFHILLNEFGEEEILALPFADDVPFMVRVDRRIKIDDHPRLLEFPWAIAGDTCSIGKAVIHRWSQLSKHNMGVDVVLTGENKNLAYLPGADSELVKEYGDIKVTVEGCVLVGSPVGSEVFRAKSLLSSINGKFTRFYDMLKLIPVKQYRLKLNRMCGGKKKLNHLFRTVEPKIWNMRVGDGDEAVSPMELATGIMLEEHRLMLDKGRVEDMGPRLTEQLGLELDHGGSGVEYCHWGNESTFLSGIEKAFDGFDRYLPASAGVRNFNLDESNCPALVAGRECWKRVIEKSAALRNMMAATAFGCLTPTDKAWSPEPNEDRLDPNFDENLHIVIDGNVLWRDVNVQSPGQKDDDLLTASEKLFSKQRHIYNESWNDFNVASQYGKVNEAQTPVYLRMDLDVQKMLEMEMESTLHDNSVKAKAKNPAGYLSLLRDWTKQGGVQAQQVFHQFESYRNFVKHSTSTIKKPKSKAMFRSHLGCWSAAFIKANPKHSTTRYENAAFLLLLRKRFLDKIPCME